MSYDDDSRAEQGRRRENIMQQRLRKSRGEEIDEDLDHGPYDDDGDVPRTFTRSAPLPPLSGGSRGGGCLTAVLYLVLGALAAMLAAAFLLNQAGGGIDRLFASVPNLVTIVMTPTPVIQSGAAVVRRIQQLSRLETAAYTVEQVIDVSQGQGNPVFDFLAGDNLLLIAHGKVVAGVDLGMLDASAVTISPDGRTISLRLPPAQIFSSTLDNEKTRVYSRDRRILAPENKDLETLARQEAERQILLAACEDGVMIRATEAAEISLQKFLGLLDYDEVVVVPSAPAACVAPIVIQVTPSP